MGVALELRAKQRSSGVTLELAEVEYRISLIFSPAAAVRGNIVVFCFSAPLPKNRNTGTSRY